MYKYYNALQNKSGDVLPGYFVRLFTAGGDPVDIFSDSNGTPIANDSGIANAAKADDLGMVRFWVENGTYTLNIYDQSDTFKGAETSVPMADAGTLADDLASSTGGQMVGIGNGRSQADLNAEVVSVFNYIPFAEQAAIIAGTSTYDCTADIHAARDAVDGTGKTLRFPGGTYYVGQVVFTGSNYTIDTAGVTFQQKAGLTTNGDGVAHPIISFTTASSDIRMGDINLIGNIATDYNEYSHGIGVFSAKNITIGNVTGLNIRGDVLYTYGRTTSEAEMQRNLVVGTVRGSNIFRCIVAMAGGDATITGIIQAGGVGFRCFDAEPNAGGAYQPVSARIRFIRGSVVQCTSDDTSSINALVSVEEVALDGDLLENSTPAYPSYPGAGAIALSINRTDTVRIGFLKLRNYEGYPVLLGDLWRSVQIGTLDFADCDTVETTYKTIALQSNPAGDGVLSIDRIVGQLADDNRMILRSDADHLKVVIGSIEATGGLLATLISGQIGSITMDCGGGSGDFFLSQADGLQIGQSAITNSANIYGLVACNNVVFSNFSANFGLGFDYTNASTNIVALNSAINGMSDTGINLLAGGAVHVNGTKVLGVQGAAVADAAGGTTVDTEARAAVNTLLSRARAHGWIAT